MPNFVQRPSMTRGIVHPAMQHGRGYDMPGRKVSNQPRAVYMPTGGSQIAKRKAFVLGDVAPGQLDMSNLWYQLPFGIGTQLMINDAQQLAQQQGATQPAPYSPTVYGDSKTTVDQTTKTPTDTATFTPDTVNTPLGPLSPATQANAGQTSTMTYDIAPQIPPWLLWGGLGLAAVLFVTQTMQRD